MDIIRRATVFEPTRLYLDRVYSLRIYRPVFTRLATEQTGPVFEPGRPFLIAAAAARRRQLPSAAPHTLSAAPHTLCQHACCLGQQRLQSCQQRLVAKIVRRVGARYTIGRQNGSRAAMIW